jgi:hypothetical protein
LTYPNQQYPGPQAVGHAAPQAYSGAPAGYGYPQPVQMAPGQQFVQPQMQQGQAPAVPGLAFQDPSRGVGSGTPAPRHLLGRTIIMVPKRVDENAKYDGQSRPNAYVDLYVIDGGPITYGDSEDKANPRPPTHTVATPCFFPNVMIGNDAFVSEVRSKLGPNGQPTGLSVGVVVKPQGKRYYAMTPCSTDENRNDRPDGDARRQAAQDIYMRHQSGEWTPPVPTPLGQVAPPQAPQVNYSQPPQAQQFNYAPQSAPPVQQGWPVTDAAQQQAPQGVPGSMPPAPGWEANPAWLQFTQEQQMSIWQSVGQPAAASAPQQPATPAGPGW